MCPGQPIDLNFTCLCCRPSSRPSQQQAKQFGTTSRLAHAGGRTLDSLPVAIMYVLKESASTADDLNSIMPGEKETTVLSSLSVPMCGIMMQTINSATPQPRLRSLVIMRPAYNPYTAFTWSNETCSRPNQLANLTQVGGLLAHPLPTLQLTVCRRLLQHAACPAPSLSPA